MFTDQVDDLLVSMDAIEALKELSSSNESAVIAARAYKRIEIQANVVLRPANASERNQFAYRTLTVDVSDGGCMLISPMPAMAGDIYWLEFSDEDLRIGSLFARCMRCRLVSEGTFELGIKFMVPIDLKSVLTTTSQTD